MDEHARWNRFFWVYTQGNLFCIKIKRWKGCISYDVATGQQEKHAPDLLQEKRGAYEERFPPQTHTNPLKKTKTFIWHLKRSLAEHVNPRFEKLFIFPVVAFLDEADSSTIHSLQEGMIVVSELSPVLL
jgi:hypothetical protein